MINNFFASDYHLSHNNVIKYDNRPFVDVSEMNETIINNHNSVVKQDDNFYFLGDFSFGSLASAELYLQRLNGNKFFIKGNHDKRDIIKLYQKYGIYLGGLEEIKINETKIVLSHYAMRVWDKSHHGSYHLYGHSHGSLENKPWGKSMDVGIMLNNYFPFSFEQIQSILSQRPIQYVDHHVNSTNK